MSNITRHYTCHYFVYKTSGKNVYALMSSAVPDCITLAMKVATRSHSSIVLISILIAFITEIIQQETCHWCFSG